MNSKTMNILSTQALAKVVAPDLSVFNNGKTFNELYELTNHTFVTVRYQDYTKGHASLASDVDFQMDYDRLEEFQAVVDEYHEQLRNAQEEVLAAYKDYHQFGEHDYLDKDNYRYFQRVGADIGFAHVRANAVNRFISLFNQTLDLYADGMGEDFDKLRIYQLMEEDGQFVLGSHAAPRVKCDCSWRHFGQCHHALAHVVTEATYATMDEAVKGLIEKSAAEPEEDFFVMVDKGYEVMLSNGEVGNLPSSNRPAEGIEKWDPYLQQVTTRACGCEGVYECQECYSEDDYETEGPFGGAFRDQEDYENWRFGGIAYLNSI